jgi:hypothetical protein
MLGALRPAYLSQVHPALLPGAISLAIGLPANLVARASSCSASPGNSSICQKRNGTQNFRIMGKAYYAYGQRFFRGRAVLGLCRGGWGYKEKCQKNTDFWGFNFGQFSKKENVNQNMDFWVSILANFQRRKIKIKIKKISGGFNCQILVKKQ